MYCTVFGLQEIGLVTGYGLYSGSWPEHGSWPGLTWWTWVSLENSLSKITGKKGFMLD